MPFSDLLDPFQLPPGFKLPQLELYDGTGEHLQGYIAHMTITSNNPDVYTKAFHHCLTGKARYCYMDLPMKTIDTYQQTADAFVFKFATSIQRILRMEIERLIQLGQLREFTRERRHEKP
ncbi:hypothetical protein LIER_40936 [Lithospermum erythrorhizon]|uniref:Uncharacterized protein n=1 Tax=Lithospermum erythrorhizon TaxID=34254 RepID=A0AAV3R391_LITER